jgi:hypothetical protein
MKTGGVVWITDWDDPFDAGVSLRACRQCGEIFGIRRACALYQPELLQADLDTLQCESCSAPLANQSIEYPTQYPRADGNGLGQVRPDVLHCHKPELSARTSMIMVVLDFDPNEKPASETRAQ